jgi:hypothetical protein
MKSWLMAVLMLVPVCLRAEDRVVSLRAGSPDVMIRAAVGSDQLGQAFDLSREILRQWKGKDLLEGPVHLKPLAPIESGISLEDYMDRKLVKVIRDAIGFSLKQISTSLEIYKMSYRAGIPKLTLQSSVQNGEDLSLTVGFEVRSLDIDVEHLQVSHHSPGVQVSPTDEDGRVRVEGQEHMTLIDDIYVRLESPDELPLISIRSTEGGIPVVRGQVTVNVREGAGGSLKLAFGGHQVEFFGGGSSAHMGDGLVVNLGTRSRIGGLDAIEFGKSEFRFKNDISGLVQAKKTMLIDLLAGQADQSLNGGAVETALRLAIDSVEVGGSRYLRFARPGPFQELVLEARLNSLGVVEADSARPQLHAGFDQSLIWLNNAFLVPDALPFPVADSSRSEAGEENITRIIRESEADAVIGIGQDFINESIFTATRGHIELPKNPDSKVDDWVQMGRSGVFLMLDRPEEKQGRVVIDLEVKPGFFPSLALALATLKRKLRFPVVIRPQWSIEETAEGPELSLKIADFDLSEETLRNGIDGVPSNLNKGINRKWLINKIRKVLSPSIGQEIRRIPLHMLQGLDLSRLVLESDGLGRLVLRMKFEEGDGGMARAWGRVIARLAPR